MNDERGSARRSGAQKIAPVHRFLFRFSHRATPRLSRERLLLRFAPSRSNHFAVLVRTDCEKMARHVANAERRPMNPRVSQCRPSRPQASGLHETRTQQLRSGQQGRPSALLETSRYTHF
jgi:hypothetical protein